MRVFALVDNASGYIWGVVEADGPIAACRRFDERIDTNSRRYEERRLNDGETGYFVFDVTGIIRADEDVTGQDVAALRRVQEGPLAAEVAVVGG